MQRNAEPKSKLLILTKCPTPKPGIEPGYPFGNASSSRMQFHYAIWAFQTPQRVSEPVEDGRAREIENLVNL